MTYRHSLNKNKSKACSSAGLLFFMAIVFSAPSMLYAQSVTSRVITTIAGIGAIGFSGDGGPATAASLDSPASLAMDAAGNIYVSDQRNSSVRKISTSGIMSTVAGNGAAGYNGDGVAIATKMNLNWGMTADAAGNLYICDQVNFRVRKVNTSGMMSTIAGTGAAGFYGENVPATTAKFQGALGIAVDLAGNVYVGDASNFRVRKISPAGFITTVAGNGSFGGGMDNVPATSSSLGFIWGLATDAAGNLYICDGTNNRVRKVDAAGIMTTIAGTGAPGDGGDGGPAVNAQLFQPLGVCVSVAGDIYIADYNNNKIKKVDASGTITTIAGTGVKGFNGDNLMATDADLFHPVSVYADDHDNVYISDLDNVRIRKISDVNTLNFTGSGYQHVAVCENGSVSLDELLESVDHDAGGTETWAFFFTGIHGAAMGTYNMIATGLKDRPAGLRYIPNMGYVGGDTIIAVVTDGVLSDTTTIYVSVNTAPIAGSIFGADNVCVRSRTPMTVTIPGGSWRVTNQCAGVTDGVITGAMAGVDTIIYTVTNSCGTDDATKEITVRGIPDAGVISGQNVLCKQTNVALSETVDSGIWSSSDPSIATIDAGALNGLLPGNIIISYTVVDSFCKGTTTHAVTIEDHADAGDINGPTTICIGATSVMSRTIANANLNGIWTDASGYAQVSADGSVLGKLPGVDTISFRVSNSCGTAISTHALSVLPLPEMPEITRKKDTLAATGTYDRYQWELDSRAIPGATTGSYVMNGPGKYALIVTTNAGCSRLSGLISFPGCDRSELNIFPNPASDAVYVSWCEPITMKLATIDGKELKKTNGMDRMDISGLPDGIYMLTVYDQYGGKIVTNRITKLSQ